MMSKPTGSTSGCLDILNVKSSKFMQFQMLPKRFTGLSSDLELDSFSSVQPFLSQLFWNSEVNLFL